MALVKVDSQRRIYIPRDMPFEAEKAIILPQGSNYLLIPVPNRPIEIDVKMAVKEMKSAAEVKAKKDALERARRRKNFK